MTTTIVHPGAGIRPEFWRDAPEPGLYPGTPYEEYSRWAAINASTLKHFARSPLHARHAMLHPDDPTEAQELGVATHAAVLEPESFPAGYCGAPKVDKRTTDGKKLWAEFVAANEGKHVLTAEEYTHCLAMRDAAWSHPMAAAILRSSGKNEVSAVWKDKTTEVVCKGRQDRLTYVDNWPTVVDVKTSKDAGRRKFSRDIDAYGYADQAAFYLDGLDTLHPFEGDRRYVFLVLEKEPPYAVAVYELDIDAINVARSKVRGYLRQYAECLESGTWPGYGDGLELVSLPPWAMKEEAD